MAKTTTLKPQDTVIGGIELDDIEDQGDEVTGPEPDWAPVNGEVVALGGGLFAVVVGQDDEGHPVVCDLGASRVYQLPLESLPR